MPLWRSSARHDDAVVVQHPPLRKRDRFRSFVVGASLAKPQKATVDSRHDSKIDIPSEPDTELVHQESAISEAECVVEAENLAEATAPLAESAVSKSLWDQAYEALREDSKDSRVRVERYELLLTAKLRAGDSDDAIGEMIQSLETGTDLPSGNDIDPPNRRSQMEKILAIGAKDMDQRRLRLYIGSKEVVVGDQMAKVSKFVNWSSGWVGVAANLNPEASIAWAAISLALPLITNPVTAREAHTDGYKEMTALTTYYARMESVYLPSDMPRSATEDPAVHALREEVQVGIRDLYKAVLDFQIRSVLRFYRNRFKNFWRDVGQIDEWSDLKATIELCDKEVKRLVQDERIAKTLASVNGLAEEWGKAQKLQQDWDRHFSQVLEVATAIKRDLTTFHAEQQTHNKHVESYTTIQLAHNEQQKKDTEKLQDMMKAIVDGKTREGLVNLLAALDKQIPGGANPHDTMARIPDRLSGTANWVLTNDDYREWLDAPYGLLLVSCPPACGKSVLSKHLIDKVLRTSRSGADILYFFFDQHTIAQALCSILHQIFKDYESLAIPLVSQFEEQASLFTSHHRLWNILKGVLGKLPTSPTIVFDAIDQCKEDTIGEFLRKGLGGGGMHMAITTRPLTELTSPFDDDELPALFRICGENQTATIAQEVQVFIKHEINELRKWPDPGKRLLEERMTEVVNPTYLWVRLIFDSIKPGRKQHFYPSVANIKKLISTLPSNLEEAYDKIMQLTKDPDQLRKAIGIIIAAQRPLTLHEMNMAMHVFPETGSLQELKDSLLGDKLFEDALRQWCSSFITIHDSRVFLLHETAKEFFTAPQDDKLVNSKIWKGSIPMTQAHLTLAESCMRSLMFRDLLDEDGEPILTGPSDYMPREDLLEPNGWGVKIRADHPKYSFIIYASIYWGPHVRGVGRLPESMHTMYEQLCDPAGSCGRSWLCFYIVHERSPALAPEHLDTIGVKCLLGHLDQVKAAINQDSGLLRPPHYRGGSEMIFPPLLAATAGSKGDVTRWLLEQDVSPNDGWGPMAPLVLAIEEGDPSILDLVSLFLQKGANTAMAEYDGHDDKSPLWAAAKRGLANIADLILSHEKETGSDSTLSVPWLKETPLEVVHDAATTRVLLKHGAYPGIPKDSPGVSPLSTEKSIEAKIALIESFKNRGGSESELLEMLRRALKAAMSAAEVALYFEHGLASYAKTEEGQRLIFSISELKEEGLPQDRHHHRAMMQELLRHCDPEATNSEGLTALQYFIAHGSSTAALFLLGQDVNFCARDNRGRTILHLAFARLERPNPLGNLPDELLSAILRAVRKHQDILHAQNTSSGWTALHSACHSASRTHVQLLLDEGLDIEARDHSGMTPLLVSNLEGRFWYHVSKLSNLNGRLLKGVPDLLMERGADLSAQDHRGRSVLHFLLNGKKSELDKDAITTVLNCLPNPDLRDEEGRTPLMCYLGLQLRLPNEHLPLFLNRGASCRLVDNAGRQVLHFLHPACDWPASSIKALIEHGADLLARTSEDETALHTIMLLTSYTGPLYKKSWHQPQIAATLLDQGAEVDAKRHDGKTPLHLACENKCFNTARVLLEAGADPAAVDAEGRTPLDLVHGEKRRQRFEELLSGSGDFVPAGKDPLREPLDTEKD